MNTVITKVLIHEGTEIEYVRNLIDGTIWVKNNERNRLISNGDTLQIEGAEYFALEKVIYKPYIELRVKA